MKTLGLKDYNADEFSLFIDSSKRSLKAVLLSNGNKDAPVPIVHGKLDIVRSIYAGKFSRNLQSYRILTYTNFSKSFQSIMSIIRRVYHSPW